MVLGGDSYTGAAQMYASSYTLQASAAWSGLGPLFALCTALGLFAYLTRRLRRLSAAMTAFSDGDGQARMALPSGGGGDEIDRVASGFNAMAERISQQLERLRHKDRLRRELVANVSHDLRTPLASLGGHLETLSLKEGELSGSERRRYLDTALQAAERLNRLVAELFELAKLEAAEIRPTPEPFSLPELVQDVMQKLAMRAQGEGVKLVQRFASGVPFVLADIGLIERVLENLLTNALRHTPPGLCRGHRGPCRWPGDGKRGRYRKRDSRSGSAAHLRTLLSAGDRAPERRGWIGPRHRAADTGTARLADRCPQQRTFGERVFV